MKGKTTAVGCVSKNFTDQKVHVVTDPDIKSFTRFKKRFACAICAHTFKKDDQIQWVYTNGADDKAPSGNPFTCAWHGTPDVCKETLIALEKEWQQNKKKFWWFRRYT